MHTPPPGFLLVPGAERSPPGGTTEVFDVERDGVVRVCKRLGSRALDEGWMRERLVAEGRLLEALGGRGAPRLVASGEDAGGPWIVMEEVPWPPLASRVGACEADWLERAAAAAFAALAAVHAEGVVHADVSPDNLLVSADGGRAVLVDFGLARAASMPPLPPGPFRGTLVYAAPELVRGEPFDARADVFALAASLLHAWSGEAPRAASSEGGEASRLLAAGEEPIDGWAGRAARGLSPELGRRLVTSCAFDARRRVP